MNGLREKFRNKKGFTLVEMLIVVAIIAILVAVSIPMVTTALEKARRGVDEANARDAISLATIEVMGDNITEKTTWAYSVNKDHTGFLEGKKAGDTADKTGVAGQSNACSNLTLSVTYDPDLNNKMGGYTTTFTTALYPEP